MKKYYENHVSPRGMMLLYNSHDSLGREIWWITTPGTQKKRRVSKETACEMIKKGDWI